MPPHPPDDRNPSISYTFFMATHQTPSFEAYLRAKADLDTRSLHATTWQCFVDRLRSLASPRILEVGAGTGTMIQRLFCAGALGRCAYWALEPQADLLHHAGLLVQALVRDFPQTASEVVFYPLAQDWQSYTQQSPPQPFDAVIAHAFVDLLDAPAFLDSLASVLRPGGLVYLSLIFDGLTQWFPTLPADDVFMGRYHADMSGPVFNGQRSGPNAGRLLWNRALETGFRILSIGPSDWVITAPASSSERTVQLWLLDTMARVLGREASEWIDIRRRQAQDGQLSLRVSHVDLLLEHP